MTCLLVLSLSYFQKYYFLIAIYSTNVCVYLNLKDSFSLESFLFRWQLVEWTMKQNYFLLEFLITSNNSHRQKSCWLSLLISRETQVTMTFFHLQISSKSCHKIPVVLMVAKVHFRQNCAYLALVISSGLPNNGTIEDPFIGILTFMLKSTVTTKCDFYAKLLDQLLFLTEIVLSILHRTKRDTKSTIS